MTDIGDQAETSQTSKFAELQKLQASGVSKNDLPGYLCTQIELLIELKGLRDILEERIKRDSFGDHAQNLSAVLTRSQRLQELSVMVIRGVLDDKTWIPLSNIAREILSGERLKEGIETITSSLFNDIMWEHADVGIIDEDLEKYQKLLDLDIAYLRKHLEYGSYYNTQMEEARIDKQAALQAEQNAPAPPPYAGASTTDLATVEPNVSTGTAQ